MRTTKPMPPTVREAFANRIHRLMTELDKCAEIAAERMPDRREVGIALLKAAENASEALRKV